LGGQIAPFIGATVGHAGRCAAGVGAQCAATKLETIISPRPLHACSIAYLSFKRDGGEKGCQSLSLPE
jgi:hypothetical protein